MSWNGCGLRRHVVEVGRPADVRRVRLPLEELALGDGQVAPLLVAREDVGVGGLEHLAAHGRRDRLLDLGRARPEVAQVDVVAVLVLAERLLEQVEVHPARERVGDHERRRGEVVRLHLRVDAGLEVAVAGEHGADDQVALLDRDRDRLRQRPGVADAGRAAVADGVEAELLEVLRQSGLVVVLGHDLRAGGEARLHPGLAAQAALDRLLRQQAGADHHLRVRRVRAGGDRGDDDAAVLELVVGAGDVHARAAGAGDRDGYGVRLGLGRAARRLLAGRVAGGERVGDGLVGAAVRERRSRSRTCRASRGTPSWRARAARGPAAGAARRATARPSRGRARAPASTSAPRSGRARACSPCSRPRRGRSARRCGRSGAGTRASARRRGRSRTSRRTPGTCSRSSRGRRAAARRGRGRSTRRTSRRRPPGGGAR